MRAVSVISCCCCCCCCCFFAGTSDGRVKASHVESLVEQQFVADTPEAMCGAASEQQPLHVPDKEKKGSETSRDALALRNVSSQIARWLNISGAAPDLGT